jgi:arsenate reductase (glutaredoxin)
MPVQIFGTRKNSATRKAERFFAERRVPVHFVDLAERAASRGELQRFAQKFGVDALVDRECRRFQELGLGPARYGPDRWLDLLVDEPLLLAQPLVRNATKLTVGGNAESEWKAWIAAGIAK